MLQHPNKSPSKHNPQKMASANKLVLISLLVAFAVVAPALQPSTAIRAEAPAPAPAGAAAAALAALPTASLFDPEFPCFSFFPPILLQLCHALFPPSPSPSPSPPHPEPEAEVKECGSWLARMKPCAGFVAQNATDQEPSDECCDGFGSIADDGATVCFCLAAVGDFGHVMPAPVSQKRMFELPGACDLPDLKLQPFAKCNMKYVPPIDLPSPPPSDDEDTD